MKRIVFYINASIFTFSIINLSFKFAFSQSNWERVTLYNPVEKSDTSERKAPKPYKDPDYNYGSANLPSPRMDAVTWTDPNGFLWVFGGSGLDENYNWGIFSDLWKYDVTANTWTVVTGNRKVNKKESKAQTDAPLSRKEAASWVDKQGNLWLYGGRQLNDLKHLDDLWVFDTRKNVWSKIAGKSDFNQKPDRGVKKATAGYPGSRSAAGTWVDRKGTFWLFGGISHQDTLTGPTQYYNDLWSFDPDSQKWTWVSGDDQPNKPTKDPKKKDDPVDSSPTPRSGPTCWYDDKQEQLWLYGGFGYDSLARQLGGLADMWVYNLKKDTWTQTSGRGALNQDFNLASARAESPKNSPGFRLAAMNWKDAAGNFLLMGGHALFDRSQVDIDYNVWKFNTSTNQWSILPTKNTANLISAGVAFVTARGDVYLFGGKELDNSLLRARPSNSIWHLKP